MDISNTTNSTSRLFPDSYKYYAYNYGMNILEECHGCTKIEQHGGESDESVESVERASKVLLKIFPPESKRTFTIIIRDILRTSFGISADIITVGAGGDVVVNAVFAIESSLSFINSLRILIPKIKETNKLFENLLTIDMSRSIPIVSELNLDDGLENFKLKFDEIINININKYGSETITKTYNIIINIISKITSTVSDWIACLFPDTAGLAGEITKTFLDYIVDNGFTLTYNLISIIPDNLQQMITNSFALKLLLEHAVTFLRNLIENINSQEILRIMQSLGMARINISSNLFRNTPKIGTSITSEMPIAKAKNILIIVINKYVIPNIDKSVILFNQLFPLFLMFTLFIEKYKLIQSGYQFYPSLGKEKRVTTINVQSENPVIGELQQQKQKQILSPEAITQNTQKIPYNIYNPKKEKQIRSPSVKNEHLKPKPKQKHKEKIIKKNKISEAPKNSGKNRKKIKLKKQIKHEEKIKKRNEISEALKKTKEEQPETILSEYNIFTETEPENKLNEPKPTEIVPVNITTTSESKALNKRAKKQYNINKKNKGKKKYGTKSKTGKKNYRIKSKKRSSGSKIKSRKGSYSSKARKRRFLKIY